MSRTPPSKGKLLYHITHMDNMQSILQNGLLSRQELKKRGIVDFVDIADPNILSKREKYREALSKYVLFHFFQRNPFDCAVCKEHGSENMAIITISRELHKSYKFLIIPSHPLDRDQPDIYPYEEGINYIRWDILDMETGRDYEIPEIKKACMAECVMDYAIQPSAFAFVYVQNNAAKDRILAMPDGYKKLNIQVAPYMFS